MNPAGGKMPPLPFRSNGTGGFQPPFLFVFSCLLPSGIATT